MLLHVDLFLGHELGQACGLLRAQQVTYPAVWGHFFARDAAHVSRLSDGDGSSCAAWGGEESARQLCSAQSREASVCVLCVVWVGAWIAG